MNLNIDLSKTAILSLHMQNDTVLQEGKLGNIFGDQAIERNVISNASELIKNARSSRIPIIHVCVRFKPDYSNLVANSALLSMVQQMNALQEGGWGGDIVEELTPLEDEIVISHQRVGPFYGTRLTNILQENKIESIILFGVATNVIVESSARVLSDEGFNVFVVEDCCSAATLEVHQNSLGSLGLLTNVIALNDILTTV